MAKKMRESIYLVNVSFSDFVEVGERSCQNVVMLKMKCSDFSED